MTPLPAGPQSAAAGSAAATDTPGYRPAAWLRELMRTHRARLPVGPSLRAAICVGAPLAAGLAFGRFDAALWVTLATLTAAAGEGAGTYRSRLRQIAIAVPFAVLGFLAGHLAALPYPAVIAAMAAAAFAMGIVSSFGAPYSQGALQALIFACVTIGLPQAGVPWQLALLYLLGVAFYAAVLAAEARIDRHRPEREMLRHLVEALADLAQACAEVPAGADETPAVEAARRRSTDASMQLYATVMEVRRNGRTRETDRLGATLDAADILFSGLLATRQPAQLAAAAGWLRTVAGAVADRAAIPALPPALPAADPLTRQLDDLAATLGRSARRPPPPDAPAAPPAAPSAAVPRVPLPVALRARFAVGREALRSAAALSLCIGLGFAARYVVPGDHWYWVPLTVAIVMKPDLGSIFARAVQRSIGTCLGVAIGVVLLAFVPKGPLLVAGIALLSALLPWAKMVSYAVVALVVTPLVLVLLDLIANSQGTVDYGAQRLADTVIGAAIVLVFGYFLWPQHRRDRLAGAFDAALDRMAGYLLAVCDPPGVDPADPAGDPGRVAAARRAAYGALSNLRAALARSLAEPPPAGREAAAWFPIVAGAERICDRITAQAARGPDAPQPPAAEAHRVAERIRGIAGATGPGGGASGGGTGDPAPADAFLAAVAADAAQLAARLDHDIAPPASGRATARPARRA